MKLASATLCVPTKNRQAAHAFYSALGFATVGEPEADGLPEPLQFQVSGGLRVMLVPSVGFGWVIGGRKRAPRGAHECLIVIGLATDADVDNLIQRATQAGARIVVKAGRQSWGYVGTFADPDGHLWHVSQNDGVLTGPPTLAAAPADRDGSLLRTASEPSLKLLRPALRPARRRSPRAPRVTGAPRSPG